MRSDNIFAVVLLLILLALIAMLASLFQVMRYPNVYAPQAVKSRINTEMRCVPIQEGDSLVFQHPYTETLVTKTASGGVMTSTIAMTATMNMGPARCWWDTPSRDPIEFSDDFSWYR